MNVHQNLDVQIFNTPLSIYRVVRYRFSSVLLKVQLESNILQSSCLYAYLILWLELNIILYSYCWQVEPRHWLRLHYDLNCFLVCSCTCKRNRVDLWQTIKYYQSALSQAIYIIFNSVLLVILIWLASCVCNAFKCNEVCQQIYLFYSPAN